MNKIDPILAVKNVHASAKWFQSLFGWKRIHGGDEFAVLVNENDEIMLCLHKWGTHEHPTLEKPNITSGNGLILYFRMDDMEEVRKNLEQMKYPIEEEIHVNPNSTKKEFSLRDPDGYYLTISEFHEYEG